MHNYELLRKKLVYQSNNRGCKETDLILSNFSKAALAGMNHTELQEYQYFLSQPDADIWDWVNEKSSPSDLMLLRMLTHIKDNL